MNMDRSDPGPIIPSERINSVDVLRGFALLGILVMNIQVFAMIDAAYFNPTAYGELTGMNYWAWLISHVLFDQKFMTIFSILFGAGLYMMADRAESRQQRATGRHYRRMVWLILFGILHAHLLWYGDILFLYGICGLVVYLFRRISAKWLLLLGFLLIGVASGISLLSGWSMSFWPPEVLAEFSQEWDPSPEVVAREVDAYRGSWTQQAVFRTPAALQLETFILLIWGFWRAGGLMLVGMALFKYGILHAKRSPAVYLTMCAGAVLVGIPTVLYGVYRNFESQWDVEYSFFFGSQYNYWGSILISLGWVGLVMLICQRPAWSAVTRPLAAVGRMALTNYILQTIICTTIFYGHGLGLFGRVERVGQLAIVAAVCVFHLVISLLWLRYFRFGPLEWLWRSMTYMKIQPIRQSAVLTPVS